MLKLERHYFNFCFYDETLKAHYSLFFFISVCVLPVQKLQVSHLKVLIRAEMHHFFLPGTGYEIPFQMFGLYYFF